jgi:hypothetical protein
MPVLAICLHGMDSEHVKVTCSLSMPWRHTVQVEAQLQSLLILVPDVGQQSTSHPGHFNFRNKLYFPLQRRSGEPHSWSWHARDQEKKFLPWIKPPIAQGIALLLHKLSYHDPPHTYIQIIEWRICSFLVWNILSGLLRKAKACLLLCRMQNTYTGNTAHRICILPSLKFSCHWNSSYLY